VLPGCSTDAARDHFLFIGWELNMIDLGARLDDLGQQ
jgi:hypothetical protein